MSKRNASGIDSYVQIKKPKVVDEQAQHLVEVSVKKLKDIQNPDTGVDLRRYLQVSTVLHKARTANLMAKYGLKYTH